MAHSAEATFQWALHNKTWNLLTAYVKWTQPEPFQI